MKTVNVKWNWEDPVCDENKGHAKSEWGNVSKEKLKQKKNYFY